MTEEILDGWNDPQSKTFGVHINGRYELVVSKSTYDVVVDRSLALEAGISATLCDLAVLLDEVSRYPRPGSPAAYYSGLRFGAGFAVVRLRQLLRDNPGESGTYDLS